MAKKRTYKEIKDALPELNSEKVETLSDELDNVLALKRIWKSDDGKILVTVVKNNCANALLRLVQEAKGQPKLETLLGIIAIYSANMDLLATIQDISMEQELRDQLDEAVKEAMES